MSGSRWLSVLLAGLTLLAAPASAQGLAASGADPRSEGGPSATALRDGGMIMPGPLSGVVDPELYVVGPGDVFVLNFSGRFTSSLSVVVGPEGTLFLPGVGSVRVSGLTLKAARRELERRAAAQFRGVTLDVRLQRARTLRVFLLGEVRQSGPLEATAANRVAEVLSDTLLGPKASRRNIVLIRRAPRDSGATSEQAVDLERFGRTGDSRFNPFLLEGDLIRVPAATRFIGVEGAVARPGTLELGPSDSLHTLLDLSGGPLPSARPERCLMVRWVSAARTESLFFDLPDVASGRFDPPLQDGDRVFVYYHPRFHLLERATILGEVVRPGSYPLQPNRTRLTDLVRAAGGFSERADLSTIRVFRGNREAGETDPELDRLSRLSRSEMTASEYEVLRARMAARREDYRFDWQRLQQEPDLDLVLRDGDLVRIDPVVATVRVEGEVRRPGLIEFRNDRTIGEYVQLAGGFARRAAPGKVRVTRAVTGQTLFARDVSAIAPGDMIWVPERPDVTTWQHLQTLIMVAGQVAAVIIAVRR